MRGYLLEPIFNFYFEIVSYLDCFIPFEPKKLINSVSFQTDIYYYYYTYYY